MEMLKMSSIRFRIDPRDIPAEKAARRLGLSEKSFRALLSNFIKRGFPKPDPDTGLYDLKAIDNWMDKRSGLTGPESVRDSHSLVQDRLAGRVNKWGK
jgi:hypothetical protein